MKNIHYEAAGGVVVHDGKFLLLDRPARGEVRLPKGHIDPGESPVETAERETIEEAGYADLEFVADLGNQTVEYDYEGQHFTRDEHYFLFSLLSDRQVPRGRKDEMQFKVLWVPMHEARAMVTYLAEQQVIERAIAALEARAA